MNESTCAFSDIFSERKIYAHFSLIFRKRESPKKSQTRAETFKARKSSLRDGLCIELLS